MKKFILIRFLFLFVTISNVVSDMIYSVDKESKVVQEYGSEVKRIHRYGDVYGVLLENTIKLQRFTSINGKIETEDLGKILLDKTKGSGLLLEFKLINNNTALYCLNEECSICRESESVSCIEVMIQNKFLHVTAEVNQNKLFLTTVENNFQASLHVFQLNEDIYKIELKNKHYESHEKHGRKSNGSFSTAEYVYFLGDSLVESHPIDGFPLPAFPYLIQEFFIFYFLCVIHAERVVN